MDRNSELKTPEASDEQLPSINCPLHRRYFPGRA